MAKINLLILLIAIILISSCVQLESYKNIGKDKIQNVFNKKTNEETIDETRVGRNAQVSIVEPKSNDVLEEGNIVTAVDLGSPNFLNKGGFLEGNVDLNQILSLSNGWRDEIFTSSNKILDAITKFGSKIIGEQFDVSIEGEEVGASLKAELTYDGYSQAKFNVCFADKKEDYFRCTNKVLKYKLSAYNIKGSEFKIMSVTETPKFSKDFIDEYKFIIEIFKSDKKGEVVNKIHLKVDLGICGDIKWNKGGTGVVECSVNNPELNKEYGNMELIFRMDYRYKLTDEVEFFIKKA